MGCLTAVAARATTYFLFDSLSVCPVGRIIRYFRSASQGAMATVTSDMLAYFCTFTDESEVQKYLATVVLAAGISNPSDLGFLCSGSSGIPKSVQLALDPDMQAQALQVLDLACRAQIGAKQGVLDLASFQLDRYQRRGSFYAGCENH